jgi:uncharacterized tellurite resistance protein B-like protein
MLEQLWKRVEDHLRGRPELREDRHGQPVDLEVQAATAILLLEAAHGDEEYVWREHRTILRGLERGFGIGKEEVLGLLGRAQEIRPPVVRLDDVTEVIAERYTREQRQRIVALLWKVIDADAVLEPWEEVFGNHVAQAVGLSPEEAEAARRGPEASASR